MRRTNESRFAAEAMSAALLPVHHLPDGCNRVFLPKGKVLVRVKFRNSTRKVLFEQCDKKFGHSRLIGVAKVDDLSTPVEVFKTEKSYCARRKVGRLYAHYFAATPGQAFAGATKHL